jgi:hypothetical protein
MIHQTHLPRPERRDKSGLKYSKEASKMLQKWNVKKLRIFLLSTVFVLTSACMQNEMPTEDTTQGPNINAPNGYASLLRVNPIVASGRNTLSAGANLNTYLSSGLSFIAPAGLLSYTCGATANYPDFPQTVEGQAENCVVMVNNENEVIQSATGHWGFSANSDDFLHVNSYALTRENIDNFYNIILSAHYTHHFGQLGKVHPSSIPIDLLGNFNLWRTQIFIEGEPAIPSTLKIKAVCDAPDSASYDPALFEICLGYDSVETKLKFAQDPSILYHELGHLFIDIMLNLRNGQSTYKSDLGTLFYEEAGAIGEGVADYFSYVTTGRTHIAEWALGRYLNQSRPLTENDPLHIDLLQNTELNEKLSYPQYLNYDPNQPEKVKEDIHYNGQIVSHYLVSLTQNLKDSCGMNHKEATTEVVSTLSETFAELGDLTGTTSDYLLMDRFEDDEDVALKYYVNLDDQDAPLWQQIVNPINFRRFFQHFAKHALYNISYNKCLTFSKDYLEQHLDDYGLLLFETYNDNLNDSMGETSVSDVQSYIEGLDIETLLGDQELGANYVLAFASLELDSRADELTYVSEVNRKKSVLISKDLIALPDENDSTKKQAFVFDTRSDVEKALKNLKFKGEAVNVSTGIAGYEYNNGNGSISPGEIVGVMLNLENNSNTAMAGIHILANDWDHFKYQDADTSSEPLPCRINTWPIPSEGAAQDDFDPSDPEAGDCGYTTRSNGKGLIEDEEPLDFLMPSCLVQIRNENETKWVSQEKMRNELLIRDNECLNSADELNANRNDECLIRILPAASHAFMSRIDAQKTYGESLQSQDGSVRPINSSAALFMEVNKFIPPGTTFVCRLRVGFNNCKDCFADEDNSSDDYYQYEFSGKKPFKVINFKFMVID